MGGLILNSRSSSTVGRKVVELNTDELHVVVDADESRCGSTDDAPATRESDMVRMGTVLLLELLNPPLSSSMPESSWRSRGWGRLPDTELAADIRESGSLSWKAWNGRKTSDEFQVGI